MVYKVLDVARYIIEYCIGLGKPISNLKLQKMLYFLWIDYYKMNREPLFAEEICAWQLGPVVPEVYYEYCAYGGMPIYRIEDKECSIQECDKSILENSIANYMCKSARELVNLTHAQGKPWEKVYNNGKGLRSIIPFKMIQELECEDAVR